MATTTREALTPGWTADASTFGARLALVRQRKGWGNVKEAAEACGVPAASWRNWERDGMEPRRITTIARQIATTAGCDYYWLLLGPESEGSLATRRYRSERLLAAAGREPLGPWGPVAQTRPIPRSRVA